MDGQMNETRKPTDLLLSLYGDRSRPGVAQVGKALAGVLGLGQTLLWPMALAGGSGGQLRANLEAYRERLADWDLDEVIGVAPELGVPIAERLAYGADPGLNGLYLNLLTKASAQATAGLAHPGFAPMIGSLSPDEARLLPWLQKEIPFLEGRLSNRGAASWRTLNPILTNLEDQAELVFPENIVAYISNLEGLGLISIRPDLYIASADQEYADLEALYRPLLSSIPHDPRTHAITFTKGKLVPTPFGKLFIKACLD